MPPKDMLSDQQIADLTAWVKMGAPWGKTDETVTSAKVEAFDLARRKAAHWAWAPVKAPNAPRSKERRMDQRPHRPVHPRKARSPGLFPPHPPPTNAHSSAGLLRSNRPPPPRRLRWKPT